MCLSYWHNMTAGPVPLFHLSTNEPIFTWVLVELECVHLESHCSRVLLCSTFVCPFLLPSETINSISLFMYGIVEVLPFIIFRIFFPQFLAFLYFSFPHLYFHIYFFPYLYSYIYIFFLFVISILALIFFFSSSI